MLERTRHLRCSDGHALALTRLSLDRGVERLGALDAASAPIFLLVHGFAQNRRTFTRSAFTRRLLDLGAGVYAGELRGHGGSRRARDRNAAWDLETLLERDLPALIAGVKEDANARTVHFVGHSLGGMLGYALCAERDDLASLTTFAAPLVLGLHRPDLRVLCALLGPIFARSPRGVPIDLALRALSSLLALRDPFPLLRLLQRFLGLVNAEEIDPEEARAILVRGDPESPLVLGELAEMAARQSSCLGRIDLTVAVKRATLPIVAIVGTHDLFAPPVSVGALKEPGHRGRRLVLEVSKGAHVDLVAGPGAGAWADEVLRFVGAAPSKGR